LTFVPAQGRPAHELGSDGQNGSGQVHGADAGRAFRDGWCSNNRGKQTRLLRRPEW
jgi:hypothetical protein